MALAAYHLFIISLIKEFSEKDNLNNPAKQDQSNYNAVTIITSKDQLAVTFCFTCQLPGMVPNDLVSLFQELI